MHNNVPLRTACLLIAPALLVAACATTPPPGAPGLTHAATHAVTVTVPTIQRPQEESAQWWFRDGAAQAAERGAMGGQAKNVILFVGDGMSLPTVAAARILDGQRKGGAGEDNRLSWEHFPATALSRTYNTDMQTPDSAGTMSAMATGVKTRAGVISIGQSADYGDCKGALDAPMITLWQLAAGSGMATGVVTTTRVTHATPAATFSHSANRGWESDSAMPAEALAAGCVDIARQLIESPYGNGPDVLMGGGRTNFMPSTQSDPEYPEESGRRVDGRDLIASWKQRRPDGSYVWNAEQFAAAPTHKPLLGLFEPSHMQYEHDRPGDPAGEPSLSEMTAAAITRLSRNPNGFVLLVEGGRIDHAHHEGNAYRALTDTIAMAEAVEVADRLTSADDTLILVTADHAHTLSFVGYPARGNPILDKVREDKNGKRVLARDARDMPYTTLSYANGPGYTGASDTQPAGPKNFPHNTKDYQPAGGRPDLSLVDTMAPDYMQEALVPATAESHGGDDVGIWARGPGSAAVRGSVEQNAIFHFMLQSTPYLRAAVCAAGACNDDGVPVTLPVQDRFKASADG
ncbi:alkaline phosphatase [Novilysobacter antarcticus]|uniref:alkaline phosphatase n=1 Tax=Novilysobacter antarcticus TaxID=2862543 RepID=UPI001C9990C6|nr:alkaline phosphatase [Lysobacter antarcticus]